MIDLLKLHKHFILTHLKEGDVAVDFTMGNGYDTEFLSKTVGESGRVYAFDVQAQALESTARHLEEVGCPKNYTLIHDSHHNVKNYVKEPFRAGMFNLGWLPGGDKSITTLRETTLPAIEAACEAIVSRMKRGGRLFYIGAGTSGRLGVLDALQKPQPCPACVRRSRTGGRVLDPRQSRALEYQGGHRRAV